MASGTACTGFNSVHGAQVPRSLVQHLEEQIARLEGDLAAWGYNDANIIVPVSMSEAASNNVPDIDTPSSRHISDSASFRHETEGIIASTELQAMISATMPLGPCLTDVVRRVRMGLTPSLPSARDSQNKASIQSRHSDGEVDASILASMPSHIIRALVKKYVHRMLPTHPFLYEPTVWEQLDRVLCKIPQKPAAPEIGVSPWSPTIKFDYDFLVIYLILAVSATLGSATAGHAARCLALSESLFQEGIRHLSNPDPHPSDMAWIQVTLLILQYASINPKLGNVWILSGLAMRDSLELGFHRDLSGTNTLDPLIIDMRRRIFWAAYCMDRSICAALRRPVSIPDPAIDTQVMSLLPDQCITPFGLENQRQATKELALRWIEYRQLQSHMTEVHFQGRPLDQGQSWEDWLAVTELRLRLWYDSGLPHDGWTEFVLHHGLLTLHRPSRRIPLPASTSLLAAFKAASASARSCREQIVSGYFPRPWLAAHHMFATALVVLFCLRHNYENIAQTYSPQEIFEMTKLFTSNLLTICAQGWSEISEYAGTYERLLAPLLESILTGTKPISRAYTPEQDAELIRLLYPSPTHPKEIRRADMVEPLQGNLPPFDATIFDQDVEFLGEDGGATFISLF